MIDFENIYNQYFREVYSFVLSLSRNVAVAEEITQETFYKALKSIDNFKGNCKVSVWLCQIAKNTYFSYIDKQKSFGPSDINEKVINNCIDEKILNKEDAFYIHMALHYLAEPYKEVFTLRVFGELSFANISLIFGKTESWARVTFHRAKLKIQNYLKEV